MYCAVEDVRGRNENLLAEDYLTASRIEGFINFAQGIIDGILQSRYPVPFSPVPDLIKGITADLAASEALSQIVGNRGDNKAPYQSKELRAKAMDLLKQIQMGKLSLSSKIQTGRMKSTTYNNDTRFGSWDPCNPDTFGDV